jgi:hypothetical protein
MDLIKCTLCSVPFILKCALKYPSNVFLEVLLHKYVCTILVKLPVYVLTWFQPFLLPFSAFQSTMLTLGEKVNIMSVNIHDMVRN